MTGRMTSKRQGECSACGARMNMGQIIFYNEGDWAHYYCSEACARSVVVPVDAASTPTYTTPTVDIAVNATQSLYRARDEAIAKAHAENMAANADLVRAIDQLRASLDKIAKWLVDDALAQKRLKL